MSLRHGWGWQPPQTASHIHLRLIQSVWAHWHAVHGHMVVALNSYMHTTLVRFRGSGSLVESKWCHIIMFKADSHLNHCFPHAVHGHTAAALKRCTHTTWPRFWGSGSLVESKWCHNAMVELGWEFQFSVLISGTPIGSRIPIPFSFLKIPVRKIFSNSAVEKSRNRNSDSEIWNSKKK